MKIRGTTGFVLSLVFFLFSASSVIAQMAADDSLLYNKATQQFINAYHLSEGDQIGLYNGTQYGNYPFSFTGGHAFFFDDRPDIGSVVYDGVLYPHVSLQYDEIQEAVLFKDNLRLIQLLNQRISKFTIFNNTFVRIVKDSATPELVKTGFYNQLYAGNTGLLKKEIKIIREDISGDKLVRYIDIHTYYYIKRNNQYISFNGKRGLLKLFADRKKDVQQFTRKSKLKFKDNSRDDSFTKMTAYYDQLTH